MDIDADAISDDINAMYDLADNVMSQTSGDPALLMPAPTAEMKAWRNWVNPDPDEVIKETNSFETMGIWDHIEKLKHSKSKLPNGASMIIEPTSAFVAVDVNTGNDFSLSAGLKANLAVAKELPNQLSLRGLGGQIIIDFAPSPKKDRKLIETALNSSFRKGKIDTVVVYCHPQKLEQHIMQRNIASIKHLIAGTLADFGADVIKIETPDQGDETRHWPPFREHAESTKSIVDGYFGKSGEYASSK